MLNIEEAIASYEKSAERYHKALLHCKAHGGEFYQEEAESNKICYEHDRQLAAWLRELQERRKEPEIITCGECELKLVCCRTIRSEGRRDDDFCSCGIREERRTDENNNLHV